MPVIAFCCGCSCRNVELELSSISVFQPPLAPSGWVEFGACCLGMVPSAAASCSLVVTDGPVMMKLLLLLLPRLIERRRPVFSQPCRSLLACLLCMRAASVMSAVCVCLYVRTIENNL